MKPGICENTFKVKEEIMTTRRALMISNPGEQGAQNYCKGVFVDIQNYKNYFTSALGGAWLASEIVTLDRPSGKQVDDEITKMSAYDYTTILFSGHGYYSQRSMSTILELRKDVEYDEMRLRTAATKRTIILDCCRKVYPETIYEQIALRAMAKVAKRAPSLEQCRRYFDLAIQRCSNDIIVGHSCSINETSGESETYGGYYASSLLIAAKNWYEQGTFDPKHYYPYSVVEAHNSAVPLVGRLRGGTQNPKIDKSRSEPYFPFAIVV
jgi:hypothetical protein